MFLDAQSDESDDDIEQGDLVEPMFFNDHIVNEEKVAPVVERFKDKPDAVCTNSGAQTTKGKSTTRKKPTVSSVPLTKNKDKERPRGPSS
ncbi:hypothetical protein FRX31_018307 [Thalictrum thalictroides]|uniref:Uncharacterized protein n=1 Tax=Thalictrum thalictroides TaxID=46969 RepID=A0A7J6W405_THATH|nr:hypothetical protein FRX31_018307 [Thalictrum thalictroides]